MKNLRSLLLLPAIMLAALGTGYAQNLTPVERDDDSDDARAIQRIDRVPNDDYRGDRIRIDRFLDVEVWTDKADAEYYEGDRITINFRTNRDAFVAVYSIDSRGRVNLLFPWHRGQDNYIVGDRTYSLPGPNDDYDLEVSGPSGREYIQIIASREPFPVPNWFGNSGVVVDEDPDDYMDYVNEREFVRYPGQRFAYDRAVVFVREWEPYYFRPVYYPTYPSWSVCGNVYIDYPWGGNIYINGIYWGCAPLYIPRVLVGWHTITVIDPYGYCWENDIHISRHHTVILDRHVVVTRPANITKYKEIRTVGYRDPVRSGYPQYKETLSKLQAKVTVKEGPNGTRMTEKVRMSGGGSDDLTLSKKYARGSGSLVRTERGLETKPSATSNDDRSSRRSAKARTSDGYDTRDYRGLDNSSSSGSYQKGRSSGDSDSRGREERRVTPKSTSTGRESDRGSAQEQPREKRSSGEQRQERKVVVPRSDQGGSSDKGKVDASGSGKSSGKESSSGNSGKSSESGKGKSKR